MKKGSPRQDCVLSLNPPTPLQQASGTASGFAGGQSWNAKWFYLSRKEKEQSQERPVCEVWGTAGFLGCGLWNDHLTPTTMDNRPWSSVSWVGPTWCRKVLAHWLWEAAAQRITCRLYPRSGWRPLALTEVSTQVRCSQEPISSTQISQALHGSSGGFLVVNLRCERKWR